MKLYEIPNYLEKKVRKSCWDSSDFIYFDKCCWFNKFCAIYYMTSCIAETTDWEEFQETPQRKRFWRWTVDLNGVCVTDFYLDDGGYDTAGCKFLSDWSSRKKKKIENDFIDCVLVDGKWSWESE